MIPVKKYVTGASTCVTSVAASVPLVIKMLFIVVVVGFRKPNEMLKILISILLMKLKIFIYHGPLFPHTQLHKSNLRMLNVVFILKNLHFPD